MNQMKVDHIMSLIHLMLSNLKLFIFQLGVFIALSIPFVFHLILLLISWDILWTSQTTFSYMLIVVSCGVIFLSLLLNLTFADLIVSRDLDRELGVPVYIGCSLVHLVLVGLLIIVNFH